MIESIKYTDKKHKHKKKKPWAINCERFQQEEIERLTKRMNKSN